MVIVYGYYSDIQLFDVISFILFVFSWKSELVKLILLACVTVKRYLSIALFLNPSSNFFSGSNCFFKLVLIVSPRLISAFRLFSVMSSVTKNPEKMEPSLYFKY